MPYALVWDGPVVARFRMGNTEEGCRGEAVRACMCFIACVGVVEGVCSCSRCPGTLHTGSYHRTLNRPV